ncbi:MAG: hypothetical protein RSG53_08890 [Oscillospiraceae bacterium]
MRKFWLKNSLGENYGLNGESGMRLINPFGFGYQLAPTYGALNHGFYAVTNKKKEPQGQCGGDLVFTRANPYADYMVFVDWMNKGYELEFAYQPLDVQFFSSVEIDTFEKTEIGDGGYLTVPVVFNKLTPWYKQNPISMRLEPSSSGGDSKRYTYRYPYRYQTGRFSSSVEVRAQGHIPSGLVIAIAGPLTNPVFTLTDVLSGEEYGRMKLRTTVQSGSIVTFSTIENRSGIDIDGVDASQYLNLANENFFQIPLNKTCELTLSADTNVVTTALIQIYDYYRSR